MAVTASGTHRVRRRHWAAFKLPVPLVPTVTSLPASDAGRPAGGVAAAAGPGPVTGAEYPAAREPAVTVG